MALCRTDSVLTIADSCASLTPRQTPRKRPYTQVFSTPLATRTEFKRLRSTLSPTPHSFRIVPASSFVEPETPTRSSSSSTSTTTTTTRATTSCSPHASRHDTFMRENATETSSSCQYDSVLRTFSSPDALCGILNISEPLAITLLRLPSYTRVLDLAWRDYRRIIQHDDDADLEMRDIAVHYVWSRHVVRVKRLIKGLEVVPFGIDEADGCDRTGSTEVSERVSLPPPTPPDSDQILEDDCGRDDDKRDETERKEEEEREYGSCPPEAQIAEMPWPASGDCSPSRHATPTKKSRRPGRHGDSALPTPDSSRMSNRRRSKRLASTF